jgi:hypothetical protein
MTSKDPICYDEKNPYASPSNITVGSARIPYIGAKKGQGAWALPGGTTTTDRTRAVAVAEHINHRYPLTKQEQK